MMQNKSLARSPHWWPDEQTLGLVRFHSESDVVLLQETNP